MKNIWIFHHYATPPEMTGLVRAYDFGKQLIKKGYKCTVFASAYLHYSNENLIENNEKYIEYNKSEVPFVFIKTSKYTGNGVSRVKNMLSFFFRLFSVSKVYGKIKEKPDVIIASSPHPLTCIAGLFIAKRYKVPCIVEVRDLWPETLVAMGILKESSLFTRLLYKGEKWIYKRADVIVFTMEGGKDYIVEKGWEKEVNLSKVHYINNGVDLEAFDFNKENYKIEDEDLDNDNIFKVIYAGSIRKNNNLGLLIDSAKLLKEQGYSQIKILIWGKGNEEVALKQRIIDENIDNICFKGRANKQYIPYILSKSNLNFYMSDGKALYRFGLSMNKSFEYFASGKPILASANSGYSIIDKYKCGICLNEYSEENFIKAIVEFYKMDKKIYNEYCKNARKAAQAYDFKVLTDKLINIIENV